MERSEVVRREEEKVGVMGREVERKSRMWKEVKNNEEKNRFGDH